MTFPEKARLVERSSKKFVPFTRPRREQVMSCRKGYISRLSFTFPFLCSLSAQAFVSFSNPIWNITIATLLYTLYHTQTYILFQIALSLLVPAEPRRSANPTFFVWNYQDFPGLRLINSNRKISKFIQWSQRQTGIAQGLMTLLHYRNGT